MTSRSQPRSKKVEKTSTSWEVLTLGDVGEIISGGTPSTSVPEYWGDEINWISPSDLTGYKKKTIKKGAKSITKLGLKNSSARLMPEGSVLFSSRAPIGYVAIAAEELSTNQGFKSIVPHDFISSEYLYYFLSASKQKAEKVASGTTFKEISKSKFAELEIPVPDLSTQKAIVSKLEELFSELDKGIESLKLAQQQLKVYRQSVLKWAFEGRLTIGWRKEQKNLLDTNILFKHIQNAKKLEAHKHGKKLKFLDEITAEERKNLPAIPKEWIWIKLGDHAFVTKLAGFEFTKYVKYKIEGDVPVIRAQNVSKSSFIPRNFVYVDRNIMEQLPRSRLYGGEILMVFVGAGLGNVGIVPGNHEYFLGPNVAKIAIEGQLNNKYVFHFLTSQIGFANVTGMSKATAQGSISMANIREVSVPLASLEEQREIVNAIETRFSILDQMEEIISQSLQHSEVLRQSILNKLLTGNFNY